MIPSNNKGAVSQDSVGAVAKASTETTPLAARENKDDTVIDTQQTVDKTQQSIEIGGRDGLEPTRYGDWEKNGRCIDF